LDAKRGDMLVLILPALGYHATNPDNFPKINLHPRASGFVLG
jgi:hypothetical protein